MSLRYDERKLWTCVVGLFGTAIAILMVLNAVNAPALVIYGDRVGQSVSSSTMAQGYKNGKVTRGGVDDTTLVYYNFDDYQNPGTDNSGNDRTLTLGTGSRTPLKTANTPWGRALEFDGIDDYAYTSGSGLDSPFKFTVSVSVYLRGQDRIGKYGYIASRYVWNTGSRCWILYITTTNHARFTAWDSEDNYNAVVSSFALDNWRWYRLTVVFDAYADTLKLYINGHLDATTTLTIGGINTNQFVDLRVGDNPQAGSGSNPFYGIIDELYIYNDVKEEKEELALWNLNEGAGNIAHDRGPLGNDATIYGATWTADGWRDDALSMDGLNDYLNVPSDLGNPGGITIDLWFYVSADDKTRTQYIMDARNGGNWWFLQSYNPYGSGNLNFNNKAIVPSSEWNAGQWNHIVVCVDSSATKIYINGELKATGDGFDPDLGANLHIGTRYTNSFYFRGKMDEICIYRGSGGGPYSGVGNDALNLRFEGSTWDGDESTGILDDKSPFDNDPVKYGDTFQCGGRYGNGVFLDGAGDKLRIYPTPPSLKPSSVSVSAWIKPSEIKLCEIVDGSTGYGGYVLRMRADGKVQFFYYKASQVTVSVISSTALSTGKWYHVMGSFDGTYLRVYINGICRGIVESPEPIYYGGYDTGFYVGAKYYGDGRYFHGIIDEVRVSNYPRTLLEDSDGDHMADVYEVIRSTHDGPAQYDPSIANMRTAVVCLGYFDGPVGYKPLLNDSCMFYNLLRARGYSDDEIFFYMEEHPEYEAPYTFDPSTVDEDQVTEAKLQELLATFRPTASHPLDKDDIFVYFWDGAGKYDSGPLALFENLDEMSPSEFASYVDGIEYKRGIYIWLQSGSGGFCAASGEDRVILASSRATEDDHGWYDHAIEAMLYHTGDYNGNGLVSEYEAWYYGAQWVYNNYGTKSQIEDNNDGTGHWYGDSGFDTSDPAKDGYVAYRTYV